MLERAYETVPFYTERFRQAGLTPDDIQSIEDLDLLAPTTKADLRKHLPHALFAKDVSLPKLLSNPRYSLASTSGTTGERLQVLFDHQAGHLPSFVKELWNLPASIPLVNGGIFTSPICAGFECHLEARAYHQRLRGTTLTFNTSDDFFHASDALIRNLSEEMEKFGPHGLFVNSWYAVWWLHRAQRLGVFVPKLNVVLPAYQYPTRVHRQVMSEAWNAPVYSNYGSTDLGGPQAGLECHRGNLHLREDNVWVDITRGGKAVAPGELGSVSITTLANPYMPLIRYEVGDVGRLLETACDCVVGETWKTFELHGRKADLLFSTTGEHLTTRLIDDIVGQDGPTFYTLFQEGPSKYSFEFFDLQERSQEETVQRLTLRLGPGEQLETRAVKHFVPERSMKYRQTGTRGPLSSSWKG